MDTATPTTFTLKLDLDVLSPDTYVPLVFGILLEHAQAQAMRAAARAVVEHYLATARELAAGPIDTSEWQRIEAGLRAALDREPPPLRHLPDSDDERRKQQNADRQKRWRQRQRAKRKAWLATPEGRAEQQRRRHEGFRKAIATRHAKWLARLRGGLPLTP